MRETASNQKSNSLPARSEIRTQSACARLDAIDEFCESGIDGLLDGRIADHYEFGLGVLAAIDSISRGTLMLAINLNVNPIDAIEMMWFDVNNITNDQNDFTDIMRIEND